MSGDLLISKEENEKGLNSNDYTNTGIFNDAYFCNISSDVDKLIKSISVCVVQDEYESNFRKNVYKLIGSKYNIKDNFEASYKHPDISSSDIVFYEFRITMRVYDTCTKKYGKNIEYMPNKIIKDNVTEASLDIKMTGFMSFRALGCTTIGSVDETYMKLETFIKSVDN